MFETGWVNFAKQLVDLSCFLEPRLQVIVSLIGAPNPETYFLLAGQSGQEDLMVITKRSAKTLHLHPQNYSQFITSHLLNRFQLNFVSGMYSLLTIGKYVSHVMLKSSFRLYVASTILWSHVHILFTQKFWRFCYPCVSRKSVLKKKRRMNWNKRNLWNIKKNFLQCPRKNERYGVGMNNKMF